MLYYNIVAFKVAYKDLAHILHASVLPRLFFSKLNKPTLDLGLSLFLLIFSNSPGYRSCNYGFSFFWLQFGLVFVDDAIFLYIICWLNITHC